MAVIILSHTERSANSFSAVCTQASLLWLAPRLDSASSATPTAVGDMLSKLLRTKVCVQSSSTNTSTHCRLSTEQTTVRKCSSMLFELHSPLRVRNATPCAQYLDTVLEHAVSAVVM
eukprot:18888-Heterococcus_DN1.PRE.2